MNKTFASLKFYNYRLWFIAAIVANIGTWMQRIAQDWLVLTELSDDSALALGIVTALQFGPALLLSPWAGLLADRLNRRVFLMISQSVQGLLALGLGVLVLGGHAQLWQVYIFATALGIITALEAPMRQVFVSELVPSKSLPNAVALNAMSFNTARLIGPALAGVAIYAIGSGWVFVVNAVSFGATVWALTKLDLSKLVPTAPVERAKGQLREAVSYLRTRHDLLLILFIVAVVSTFTLHYQVTSALMARVEFGHGASEYGFLGTTIAIGSVAGALHNAKRSRPRVRTIAIASALAGLATAAMAMSPSIEFFAVASVLMGYSMMMILNNANAAMQTTVEGHLRGRVMSVYMVVLAGGTPVGATMVGWISDSVGPRWAIGLGSAAALLAAAGAYVYGRRTWGIRLRPSVKTAAWITKPTAPAQIPA